MAGPNWVLGSHDVPRLATRLGPAQARVASLLLMTLPGTPFLYYGDELGLKRSKFSPEEAVDPYEPFGLGRDAERGPMPWTSGPNAGFTTGKPWLQLAEDHDQCNVEVLKEDEQSTLNLHRRLIALRREHPALVGKGYEPAWGDENYLAFFRTDGAKRYFVAANFSGKPVTAVIEAQGSILVSTTMNRSGRVENRLDLAPNEAVLVEIEKAE